MATIDIKYITEVPPYLETAHGKAWRIDLEDIRTRLGYTKLDDSVIVCRFVECRWAHQFWANYVISTVHLRDLPGKEQVVLHLPGATHEIMVSALSPDKVPDFKNPFSGHMLPPNFIGQFICKDDLEASIRTNKAINLILDKKLSPDTDSCRAWTELFSDSNFY